MVETWSCTLSHLLRVLEIVYLIAAHGLSECSIAIPPSEVQGFGNGQFSPVLGAVLWIGDPENPDQLMPLGAPSELLIEPSCDDQQLTNSLHPHWTYLSHWYLILSLWRQCNDHLGGGLACPLCSGYSTWYVITVSPRGPARWSIPIALVRRTAGRWRYTSENTTYMSEMYFKTENQRPTWPFLQSRLSVIEPPFDWKMGILRCSDVPAMLYVAEPWLLNTKNIFRTKSEKLTINAMIPGIPSKLRKGTTLDWCASPLSVR